MFKRKTKVERVFEHLLNYGSITQNEANKKYGASRLSAIIFDFKNKDGLNILSRWEKGKDRYGYPTRYVRYVLVEKEK